MRILRAIHRRCSNLLSNVGAAREQRAQLLDYRGARITGHPTAPRVWAGSADGSADDCCSLVRDSPGDATLPPGRRHAHLIEDQARGFLSAAHTDGRGGLGPAPVQKVSTLRPPPAPACSRVGAALTVAVPSSPSSTADTSLPDLASGSSGHASSAAAPTSPQALVEPAALPGRSNLTNGAAGRPLTPVYSFRPDDFSPLPKGIKDPIKDAEKPYWDSEFVLGFLSGSSKSQKMVRPASTATLAPPFVEPPLAWLPVHLPPFEPHVMTRHTASISTSVCQAPRPPPPRSPGRCQRWGTPPPPVAPWGRRSAVRVGHGSRGQLYAGQFIRVCVLPEVAAALLTHDPRFLGTAGH